ncbi:metalloregulator ArsR/SmtB family transcription factor [Sedimentibacter sp.]|uniref:ArsR/SmtB family transcription factor n=1 Tax=Sedimentibacter sp. TaxID=1960295 RepID=UPI0028A8BD56|nr:metalloregulator ArsR/SmtB family transcription factor [Sedimentibacter sp.]
MDNFKDNDKIMIEYAEMLKALAHPVRLCIVHGLINCNGCNVSNIQNCLNMPQSTISQHLSKLRSYGIITGERNGLEIIYRVSNDKVKALVEALFEEYK